MLTIPAALTAFSLADIGDRLFSKKPGANAQEPVAVSTFAIPSRFFPQPVGVFFGKEVGYPNRFLPTEGDMRSSIARALLANEMDIYEGSPQDSVQVRGAPLVDRIPFKFAG